MKDYDIAFEEVKRLDGYKFWTIYNSMDKIKEHFKKKKKIGFIKEAIYDYSKSFK